MVEESSIWLDMEWERTIASTDIGGYIAALDEPNRSLCSALILEGESVKDVALAMNVSTKTILRRTRKALANLGANYGIRNASKYLPANNDDRITIGKTIPCRSGCQVTHGGTLRPAITARSEKGTPDTRFSDLPPRK